MEKCHSFSGFTLLLGSILQDISTEHTYLPGITIFSSLAFQCRDLDSTRFSLIKNIHIHNHLFNSGTAELSTYIMEFLGNPERSGTHVFDQHCYAIAVKECLQLCLCSYHYFSKRVIDSSAHSDRMLRRNQPWLWRRRLSRIRKSRHWLKVQQHNKNEDHQSLVYKWALDLLPFLLERSAISLELAEVLHSCTFTVMALEFPWRMRMAKDAMRRYILRVESTMDDHGLQTELSKNPDI
jgi:hypothetical protein